MKLHPPLVHGDDKINRDILRPLFETSWRWWALFGLCLTGFGAGFVTWMWMLGAGMWVTGLHRPVMWGVFIANFVFWVGLSHSGTLISAILRLAKADWRRPITRAAEAMTVFTVLMAAQFPLIHLGRTWFFYYIIPYVNQREMWGNFRSPLAWDLMAILTYLSGSLIYLYLPTVPDFAIARDYATTPVRKKLFTMLALGWRGTRKEWHRMNLAILMLAVLVLPVAVSVHTIVSWDFAMALAPQWHTTIFGPYFVLGAIYSGMALVVTLTVLIRWAFKWEDYITPFHLDKLSKIMLVAAILWTYLWCGDYLITWYGRLPEEKVIIDIKNGGPFFWHQLTMMLANTIVAIPMLAFKKVRTSPWALMFLTIFINVGMWLERYLIAVPTLVQKGPSYTWTTYSPTWVELMMSIYPFAGFVMLYVLFVKMAPFISIWEIREDRVAEAYKTMGQAKLRAIVAE
ncbi:MAG: NrfD/PsrC family molybdoenzyme membrane anchor subunit [Candidatus Sericytochromatia bacterium]|nr:NrfD/PsrC family molybdoenzyme membrane anchor subunit [Candidatus Sericytochromatia bacterium]